MRPPPVRPLIRGLLLGKGTGFGFAQTLVAQVVVVLLNVGTGVLTARLLGAEGRGVFAAIIMWPQLLASIGMAGLPFALTYHLGSAREEAGRVLGTCFFLALALAALTVPAGVFAIAAIMGDRYAPDIVLFTQVFSVLTVANLFSMLAKQAFSALGRIRLFNLVSWADPGLYLALLVPVAAVTSLTPQLAAACLFLQTIVVVGWSLRKLFLLCRPSASGWFAWAPRIASYAARASGAGMLASLVSYLDRLVLVALISPQEFGLYVVAFSFSRVLMVLQTAVGAVVLPAMVGVPAEDAKALHDRTFALMLLAIAVTIVGAYFLAEPALVLFYGTEFTGARLVMVVLVVEASLSCLCCVTAQLFLAFGRPSFVSAAQGGSFVATAVGLAVFAPLLGSPGAALAVTAGTAVRLVILLAGIRLRLRLPLRIAPAIRELPVLVRSFRST